MAGKNFANYNHGVLKRLLEGKPLAWTEKVGAPNLFNLEGRHSIKEKIYVCSLTASFCCYSFSSSQSSLYITYVESTNKMMSTSSQTPLEEKKNFKGIPKVGKRYIPSAIAENLALLRMKFYWFNKQCCVPECFNSSTEGEGCFKEYFDLPAEPQARARWLNAILTEDGENLKICEDHFKDDDVFRDKNNRKKLRLNSTPSMKLPKFICCNCLGSKTQLFNSLDFQPRACQCGQSPTALQTTQPSPTGKRSRITWTAEEKKILFRAIKNYGDVRIGNNNIRINWASVTNQCRTNGCFGNEKELKNAWQTLRINATKVYKNEIFGSKLERKVSRFLYGKSPKRSRNNRAGCSSANGQNMETMSTDDEEEPSQSMIQDLQDEEEYNGVIVNDIQECEPKVEQMVQVLKDEVTEEEEESDEYYSISDVEQIFQIKIRPKPPEKSAEVISLLSSDDEE